MRQRSPWHGGRRERRGAWGGGRRGQATEPSSTVPAASAPAPRPQGRELGGHVGRAKVGGRASTAAEPEGAVGRAGAAVPGASRGPRGAAGGGRGRRARRAGRASAAASRARVAVPAGARLAATRGHVWAPVCGDRPPESSERRRGTQGSVLTLLPPFVKPSRPPPVEMSAILRYSNARPRAKAGGRERSVLPTGKGRSRPLRTTEATYSVSVDRPDPSPPPSPSLPHVSSPPTYVLGPAPSFLQTSHKL